MIHENRKYRVLEAEMLVDKTRLDVRMLYIDDGSIQYKSDVLEKYPDLHFYLMEKEDDNEELYGVIVDGEAAWTEYVILSTTKLTSYDDETYAYLTFDDSTWGFLEDELTIEEYAAGKAADLE